MSLSASFSPLDRRSRGYAGLSSLFGNLGLQSRWDRDGVVDGVSMRVALRWRVHLEGSASELGFASGGEEVLGW